MKECKQIFISECAPPGSRNGTESRDDDESSIGEEDVEVPNDIPDTFPPELSAPDMQLPLNAANRLTAGTAYTFSNVENLISNMIEEADKTVELIGPR